MSEIAKRMAELGDPDPQVRMNAASWLGQINEVRAVPQLTAALKDGDWRVREKAAEALGKIGDPETAGALIDACANADIGMRTEIAMALAEIGKRGDAGVRAVAQRGLRNRDSGGRKAAAWALKAMEREACVPYLVAGLADTDIQVRIYCASGLETLAPKAWIDLVKVAESLARYYVNADANGDSGKAAAGCSELFGRIKAAVDAADARRTGMLSAGMPRQPARRDPMERTARTAI